MDTHIPPFQNAGRWLEQLEAPETAPDALGRTTFVCALTDALVQLPTDRSVVTAVFGPWGSGKTWLLEQVVQRLDHEYGNEMITCRFSPWELKSEDQILAEFFATISAKIPRDDSSADVIPLWKKLQQLTTLGAIGSATIIGSLAVSGGLQGDALKSAEAFAPMLQSITLLLGKANESTTSETPQEPKTLREVKDQLAKELKEKLSRPILVVIDDLDRLTHSEIQLMIRLLNTTANLPKIHYLVFGDRQQISSALNPICGDQGDRYLEKLVQNSFQVPEPGENQIRLRLWDGFENIATAVGESPAAHSKRFSEAWDLFLKFRIKNLRDCHRILRTFSFHSGSLLREGTLEVDLVDLLSIDFLRVFDPALYEKLATEIPTKDWCSVNLARDEEKKDSKRILDLISASNLESRIACGALLFTFHHLYSHISNLLKSEHLSTLRYYRFSKSSALSITEPNRAAIYFRLALNTGDLPEVKVKEFTYSSDVLHLTKLLEHFKTHGWIPQLLSRLRSDPDLFKEPESIGHLLQAISSFSDDLGDIPGFNEGEYDQGLRLCDDLVSRLSKTGNERKILPAILDVGGVSIALYLLETLRHWNKCQFFTGAKGSNEILRISPEEIEELSDSIYPHVEKNFLLNLFIKGQWEASRSYRMAHALGPRRCEHIFIRSENLEKGEKIWRIIEAIALSIMPSIDIDSWEISVEGNAAGSSLLSHLQQFASLQYWKRFITSYPPEPQSKFAPLVLPHLKNALDREDEEPN